MGKPCLLLRKNTERIEGINENVVLSRYNSFIVQDFMRNYASHERLKIFLQTRPSNIIVNRLAGMLNHENTV